MPGEIKEAIKTFLKLHPARDIGLVIEGLHEGAAGELEQIGGPAKYLAAMVRAAPLNIAVKVVNGISDTVASALGEGIGTAVEVFERLGERGERGLR